MNTVGTAALQYGPTGAISREDMANLPIRRYAGEVCLVATPPQAERALAEMQQEDVVGFDTETRPAFRKGEVHLPCLVQVATARRVYLFQLRHAQVFPAVAALLTATRVVKAGVALAQDLRALRQLLPFAESNVLDLGIVARHNRIGQTGLRNLAGIFLGARIPKGARTSNWAASKLSPAQITYAATDAWVYRELYLRFRDHGLLQATAQFADPPPAPAETGVHRR